MRSSLSLTRQVNHPSPVPPYRWIGASGGRLGGIDQKIYNVKEAVREAGHRPGGADAPRRGDAGGPRALTSGPSGLSCPGPRVLTSRAPPAPLLPSLSRWTV
ncbi:hypothetical protein GCM10018953_33580 [Streptosporangium nondiastaticum]